MYVCVCAMERTPPISSALAFSYLPGRSHRTAPHCQAIVAPRPDPATRKRRWGKRVDVRRREGKGRMTSMDDRPAQATANFFSSSSPCRTDNCRIPPKNRPRSAKGIKRYQRSSTRVSFLRRTNATELTTSGIGERQDKRQKEREKEKGKRDEREGHSSPTSFLYHHCSCPTTMSWRYRQTDRQTDRRSAEEFCHRHHRYYHHHHHCCSLLFYPLIG
jgi:hypothetical protein